MEHEATIPSPEQASEKKPHTAVSAWPSTAFGADHEGAAVVSAVETVGSLSGPLLNLQPGIILPPVEYVSRPVPCRIFNREPTGTRRRGLKCETCGAQADQGETIVCTR